MREDQQFAQTEISFFANLLDRCVFKITGPDALTFLQGQFTNDVMSLNADTSCIYGAFLTPQGKLITDAFLVKHPSDNTVMSLLVDVSQTSLPLMLEQFRKLKLRSKFEVISQEEISVYVSTNNTLETKQPNKADEKTHIVVQDPRDIQIGFRIYATQMETTLKTDNPINDANLKQYHYLLAERVIPYTDTILTPQRSFIMEYGFEKMNGVSFTKGCYVGQELTSRMYHRHLDKRFLVSVCCTPLGESSIHELKELVVGAHIVFNGIDMGIVKAYHPPHFICHLSQSEMMKKFPAATWSTTDNTVMIMVDMIEALQFRCDATPQTIDIKQPVITFRTRADLMRFET